MEFMAGGNLYFHLQRRGVAEMAEAIGYLHGPGRIVRYLAAVLVPSAFGVTSVCDTDDITTTREKAPSHPPSFVLLWGVV
jgi:hypothetical protein